MDTMDEAGIRAKGILGLNEVQDPTAALWLPTFLSHDRTHPVEISRRVYGGQIAEEILERARNAWREADR